MNNVALFVVLFFSLSSFSVSQADYFRSAKLPDSLSQLKKHAAKTPKMFWVASGVLAGSMVFDAETTTANMRAGAHEVWSPLLYGRRPDRPRFYGASIALDGALAFASYRLVRMDHSKWGILKNVWKVAGWGLMAYQTQDHLRGGIHNISVRRKSR